MSALSRVTRRLRETVRRSKARLGWVYRKESVSRCCSALFVSAGVAIFPSAKDDSSTCGSHIMSHHRTACRRGDGPVSIDDASYHFLYFIYYSPRRRGQYPTRSFFFCPSPLTRFPQTLHFGSLCQGREALSESQAQARCVSCLALFRVQLINALFRNHLLRLLRIIYHQPRLLSLKPPLLPTPVTV